MRHVDLGSEGGGLLRLGCTIRLVLFCIISWAVNIRFAATVEYRIYHLAGTIMRWTDLAQASLSSSINVVSMLLIGASSGALLNWMDDGMPRFPHAA